MAHALKTNERFMVLRDHLWTGGFCPVAIMTSRMPMMGEDAVERPAMAGARHARTSQTRGVDDVEGHRDAHPHVLMAGLSKSTSAGTTG